MLLAFWKRVYAQAFTCLGKALGCCRSVYLAGLEELYPLVKRSLGHLVEIVYPQHVVFGKDVASVFTDEYFPLAHRQLQYVILVVKATELRLAVVDIVLALAEVEVDNVYRVYFAYLVVVVAEVNVFRDGL